MSREPPARDVPWIPPDHADPDGFVGVGGDLAPRTLLRAYAEGVFPWFNEGDPILWWSPHPRAVIELEDGITRRGTPGYGGLHVPRRLARTIRSDKFRVTVNQRFEEVMRACGENREGGTWVTDDMLAAYTDLHRLGHAHSVETWVPGPAGLAGMVFDPYSRPTLEGWELVGGVYGVAVGGVFAAESMFFRLSDASKVALAALVTRLRDRGFVLLDVQMKTPHTERMGATNISRREYLRRLRDAVAMGEVSFV